VEPPADLPEIIPTVSGEQNDPEISKPEGEPPTELVVVDVCAGSGEEVTDITRKYLWSYEGVSWSTGEVFDSSFQRGAPIPFALNEVIPGWTEGLQGMKVGGRRLLVIPPDQAYGAQGSPPAIGPNETLVFVVDLVGPAV
jgi:peptidylprolyl isomerase